MGGKPTLPPAGTAVIPGWGVRPPRRVQAKPPHDIVTIAMNALTPDSQTVPAESITNPDGPAVLKDLFFRVEMSLRTGGWCKEVEATLSPCPEAPVPLGQLAGHVECTDCTYLPKDLLQIRLRQPNGEIVPAYQITSARSVVTTWRPALPGTGPASLTPSSIYWPVPGQHLTWVQGRKGTEHLCF